jgi:hypothetical protein
MIVKSVGTNLAAPPRFVFKLTELAFFGSVDAPNTDRLAMNLDSISIDDRSLTGNRLF